MTQSDDVEHQRRRSSVTFQEQVSLKERLHHMTWAWYAFTTATGGLALVFKVTPHRFKGLDTIGEIVFLFDLVCFSLITIGITIRFILFPGTLSASLRNTSESLLFPTFWLSLAVVIANTSAYGVAYCGPWLLTTIRMLFWIYTALSFLLAIIQYYYIFTGANLTTQDMTPGWIFPILPATLSGMIAGVITKTQPRDKVLDIAIAGLTMQGLGFFVSILMFAIWIQRLVSQGLPKPDMRPGMFISVGPPAFTSLTLIRLANNLHDALPPSITFWEGDSAVDAIRFFKFLALSMSIFIWTLAFWFFAVALVSVVVKFRDMEFHLIWWAMVFPNTGFTIATTEIGMALQSEAILWVATAMTIALVATWAFVLGNHGVAVWRGKIMWPGRDEDQWPRVVKGKVVTPRVNSVSETL